MLIPIRSIQLIISFFTFLSTFHSLLAQTDQEVYLFDKNTNPGAILTEIPQEKPRLEGSSYLYEEWKVADLVLKNNSVLNGVHFKYDMVNEIFELNRGNFVKNLSPNHFKEIRIYENLPSKSFKLFYVLINNGRDEEGIVEIIHTDEDFTLAQKTYVEIKNPTYVPTHHAGNMNMEVLRKQKLYIIKNKNYISFKRNKSSLSEISGVETKKIKNFIKQEKLDLKNDSHLVEIIKFVLI